MTKKNRVLNRFLKLVRIDSPSRHEKAVVKHVRAELRKMGYRSEEDRAGKRIGGDAGNVWVFVKGNVPDAPRIMLNAHLDTVAPGKNIKPRVRNRYVVSDGTTILGGDNKAGVAVLMETLKRLKEEKTRHGDITVLLTISEEIGLLGSKSVSRKKLKADFGFTLDGGDIDEIINSSPSQDNLRCSIFGKAAHAGVRPEEGISAIKVASEAIAGMKLGRLDDETTANIGKIKGGVATNIIPDRVDLRGEARSHNPKKLKTQIDHMKNRLVRACRKIGARLDIKISHSYRSFKIDRNSRLLKLAVKAAKSLNIKPIVKGTGGGFDANIFNSLGVPTVIIGTGADRVHTTRERVSIPQMQKSVQLVMKIISEVASVKK